MATTIDYSGATYRVVIPQADLTLVSGSLYELNTNTLRTDLKALEAATTGIVYQDTHRHNTEVTVAGVTFARLIEIINATNSSQTDVYEIFFSPDTTYSVRLAGSNNNIFDLENAILANTVTQVISQNSAGLQIVTSGSGVTAQDKLDIADRVWDELIAGHLTAGTTGKSLDDAGAAGNPWSTPVAGNTTAGTFGELVGKKLLTVAKFLGLK